MKHENNVRKAKVVRVVNANTLDLDIDLGMGMKVQRRVDLARVSPREQFDEIGAAAAAKLRDTFSIVKDVTIQFDRHPDDPYRVIAEVWLDTTQNLNDSVLADGLDADDRLSVNALG